uniref:GTH-alpha n=1 Tax=Oncorhynchus mykiss TaxID=8022 RepID=A0A8C7TK70_ONCMY
MCALSSQKKNIQNLIQIIQIMSVNYIDRRGTCKGTHVVYACVGYCESSAFPSRYSVLVASNFTHITSASRCCTISKDAKIKVRLNCPRARHHNDIEILTARACHCDVCHGQKFQFCSINFKATTQPDIKRQKNVH